MQAPRRIASYGRRHGRRLRAGKQSLLDVLLPQLSIARPEEAAKPASLFAKKNPLWLEIGFGGGEHLAHMAGLYADVNFIGCEIYVDGIAGLLSHIEQEKLSNIRLYTEDARGLMEHLPDASVAKIFLLYPDPWPKNRHHKRRILNAELLTILSRIMQKGAELRIATDHADYATWMLERLLPHPDFSWTAKTCDDWLKPWADWKSTRYEQKALAGRPTYLTFIKK